MRSATLLESIVRVLSLHDSYGVILIHVFLPSFLFVVTLMIFHCHYSFLMYIICLSTFVYLSGYCNMTMLHLVLRY